MGIKPKILILVVALLAVGVPLHAVGNWSLTLPDTVHLDDDLATLGDLALGPIPAYTQDLVVRAGLEPNSIVTVSRQDILRRLVTAGLAHGVRLQGAERCRLIYAGQELTTADLQNEVRRAIQHLVPPTEPGAPDSWLELDFPDLKFAVTEDWKAETGRTKSLEPGRNLVPISLVEEDRTEGFAAVVILHVFGEIGRLRQDLSSGRPLEDHLFDWQWQDMADLKQGLAVNRRCLQGASSSRNLRGGDFLRSADLKETPVILSGDVVELQIKRGQVAVTVQGIARRNGCLGQTIPVRSEMTGRLVNARVAGPGRVEWRK